MTKHYPFLILTIALLFSSHQANAQWDMLGDLFNQMDTTTENQFDGDFFQLDSTWSLNPSGGNGLIDSLYDEIGGGMPDLDLDSSFLDMVGMGLDSLFFNVPGLDLPGADEDTLFGELGLVDSLFAENFDSLGGLFGQYQDSLLFDSTHWNVVVVNHDTLQDQQWEVLTDSMFIVTDTTVSDRPDSLAPLIGKFFDFDIFPDLELAFGIQEADLKYYDEEYEAKAKVFRIGSVPAFTKTSLDCHDGVARFPIEARWHLQASFTSEKKEAQEASGAEAISSTEESNYNFKPLIFNGEFALMATPTMGRWGNTHFRFITSLGTELGTYAPAHRDYDPIYTAGNKGNFTSMGPQAGTGFSMTTGPLIVYSLGTVSLGKAMRCPMPYTYTSRKFEVGIRYGNIVNIRYMTGKMDWQQDGNRYAKIGHHVTLGIILASLNH